MPSLEDCLERLEQRCGNKITLGLSRVEQVAADLDLLSPHCPVITVAGTNGKGSCVAILESILQAAGYCTGVYTSPHLLKFNERIRIQGQPLTDQAIVDVFLQISNSDTEQRLSYFEFITLAALLAFKQQSVDIMILEVGLGGRLDAVNIIDPTLAVITSIGLDHQDWLGHDRESIAAEKAGIFRENQSAVCGDMDIPQAIYQAAEQKKIDLLCLNKDFNYQQQRDHWCFTHPQGQLNHLPIPKLELQNAATALMALHKLPWDISYASICQGLADLCLSGRFQVVKADNTWVYDVAHNEQAAELLANNLRKLRETSSVSAVFSALADKDISAIISPLAAIIDEWYIAPLTVPRAASITQLKNAFTELSISAIHSFSTVAAAVNSVHQAHKNKRGLIVVFGSFYTVSDVIFQRGNGDGNG